MYICRYIDSQYHKVMQDIVSSKLYKEQFEAIQECFRNIGFTEEVRPCSAIHRVLGYRSFKCSDVCIVYGYYLSGGQLCLQHPLGHSEHWQH